MKVCISRYGKKRTFVGTYCIVPGKGGLLINIQFADDFDKSKGSKKIKKPATSEGYQGPELASLELKVQELIEQFVQHFGVNDDFFQKTLKFGLAYEQKFYI